MRKIAVVPNARGAQVEAVRERTRCRLCGKRIEDGQEIEDLSDERSWDCVHASCYDVQKEGMWWVAEWRAKIDQMTHVEMARFQRFAPSGHLVFDSALPLYVYFKARFDSLGGMTPEVSKEIGWEGPPRRG